MKKTQMRRTTLKVQKNAPKQEKSSKLTYTPIAHHVYHDGYAYRTRVSVNGKTIWFSTKSKTKAIRERNRLLAAREQ